MPTQPSSQNPYDTSSGGGGIAAQTMGTTPYTTNAPKLGTQPIDAAGGYTQAPSGYQYDPVQNRYVPVVGSPSDVIAQRARAQGIQNTLFGQEQQAFSQASQPGYGGGGSNAPSFGAAPQAPVLPSFPSLQGVPAALAPAATQKTAQIQFPDMSAAQKAAFNTAKNQQGQVTQSALSGLQSSLAGRGLLGGGYEGKGTTDIVQQGAQALGDLSNQQAVTQANQALQSAQTGYQGAVTQRGQDISAQQTAQQQALEQQNQLAQQALAAYGSQAGLAEQQYGTQLGAYNTQNQQKIQEQQVLNQQQIAQQQLRNQAMQGLMGSLNSSLNSQSTYY